jgi:DNA uptake protein ComE-like DNA-binding protein
MSLNDLKKLFRSYFTFNRSERQGFTILAILLAFSVLINFLSDQLDIRRPDDFSAARKIIKARTETQKTNVAEKQVSLFLFNPNTITADSLEVLDLPDKIKSNMLRYREKGGRFQKPDDFRKLYGMSDSLYRKLEPYIAINDKVQHKTSQDIPKDLGPVGREYFRFDPNSVTALEMERLGFSRFLQRNIQSYRDKGGKFNIKSDLARIYGMDSVLFRELEPWIALSENYDIKREKEVIPVLDINRADSAAFLSLPGIGPSFSGRIVRFRTNLGGYHSLDQLRDIYGMTEERFALIVPYLSVTATGLRQIRINFAEVNEMRTHPYISAEAARKIIQVRSDKGPYLNLEALKSENIFDDEIFEKLRPYLICN